MDEFTLILTNFLYHILWNVPTHNAVESAGKSNLVYKMIILIPGFIIWDSERWGIMNDIINKIK